MVYLYSGCKEINNWAIIADSFIGLLQLLVTILILLKYTKSMIGKDTQRYLSGNL